MNARLFDVLHDAADDDGAGVVGDGVDVQLERVLQELIDQHRMLGRGIDGVRHVAIERVHVVHDRHPASAEDVGRPHHHRKAHLRGHLPRFLARRGGAAGRLRNAEIPQQLRKPAAILREVDRVRRGAENLHAGVLQRQRKLQRRLAAELHEARHVAAAARFLLDHRHHVFERQRLEIQPVGRCRSRSRRFPGLQLIITVSNPASRSANAA